MAVPQVRLLDLEGVQVIREVLKVVSKRARHRGVGQQVQRQRHEDEARGGAPAAVQDQHDRKADGELGLVEQQAEARRRGEMVAGAPRGDADRDQQQRDRAVLAVGN